MAPCETFDCHAKAVRSIGAVPIDELPNFREECVRKRNGLKQARPTYKHMLMLDAPVSHFFKKVRDGGAWGISL